MFSTEGLMLYYCVIFTKEKAIAKHFHMLYHLEVAHQLI